MGPWLCGGCNYLNADGVRCGSCGRYIDDDRPSPADRVANDRKAWLPILLVCALITVLCGDTAVLALIKPKVATIHYPEAWDARVLQLVDFVEHERGLSYTHPVDVQFLSPAEYSKATRAPSVADGPSSGPDEGTFVSILRAVGMAPSHLDLGKAGDTLADEGTLAFYDDATKRVVVRGTTMSVGLRVTLAHELTHVLQDQRFGLKRKFMTDGARTAFRAVVEGDADRIENAYVESLSPSDKKAYFADHDAVVSNGKSALGDVPTALIQLFAAPYSLGDPFVAFIAAARGNEGVDEAIRRPPPSEKALFQPFSYFQGATVQAVAAPSVDAGDKKLDEADFGPISWFLMLASHVDDRTALRAVDGWAGDAYVAYRHASQTCVRLRFVGDSPADGAEMAAALDGWKGAFPAGLVSTTRDAATVNVQSCDAGAAVPAPIASLENAMVVPASRTAFAAELLKEKAPEPLAQCAAEKVIAAFTTVQLAAAELPAGSPDPVKVGIAAGKACVKEGHHG